MSSTAFRYFATTVAMSVAAAATLLASSPVFAGEALDIELPSMRTPVQTAQPTLLQPNTVFVVLETVQAITREQVREELRQARAAGTVFNGGEAGDSDALLEARERYSVAQAEAIVTAQRAEQARQLALLQAEAALLAMSTLPDSDIVVSVEFFDLTAR